MTNASESAPAAPPPPPARRGGGFFARLLAAFLVILITTTITLIATGATLLWLGFTPATPRTGCRKSAGSNARSVQCNPHQPRRYSGDQRRRPRPARQR